MNLQNFEKKYLGLVLVQKDILPRSTLIFANHKTAKKFGIEIVYNMPVSCSFSLPVKSLK